MGIFNVYIDGVLQGGSGGGGATIDGYETVATVLVAETKSSTDDKIIYVVENESWYKYEATAAAQVRDGLFVLNTGGTGDTRWLAIGGKYLYNGLNTNNDIQISSGNSLTLTNATNDSSVDIKNTGGAGVSELTITGNTTVEGSLTTEEIAIDTTLANPSHSEGLIFYDNTKKALSYYNESSDITVNLGRELLVRVINNSGSLIPNGSVVYPAGVSSDLPEIELATATEEAKSKVVGVTTQDIANGAIGYVTKFGQVGDVDTSGFTAGDIIYLSDTAGEFTTTKPTGGSFVTTIGVVEVVDGSAGRIIVDIIPSQLSVEITDQNGFPSSQRTGTTLAFVDGTRTFTIAPTGSDFYFYQNGQKYLKTSSESVVIDNAEGLHVIYYDEGVLTAVANPSDGQIDTTIKTKCIVAYVYWNATDLAANYIADERHGISMSPITHAYLHFTVGAKYLSGLALNTLDVGGSGDDTTAAQFGVDSGVYTDEDLITTTSTIASTTGLPIYYLSGTAGDLRKATKAGFSVLDDITAGVGTTGRLVYNEFTGVTWQLSTVNNNDFVLCHVFAINAYASSNRVIAVIGQNQYANSGTARAGAEVEISDLLTRIPAEEIIPVATLIFQTSYGYGNAVKARVISTSDGDDYVDWRTSELTPGSPASSHNNLANLQLANTGVAWGHIDDQAQTIYGNKTFAGTIYSENIYNTTTASAGNVYVDTDGSLKRSTSSLKYKKDIKYLKPKDGKIIYDMKPFTYADSVGNENKNWRFYGLGAEHLDEIDKKLVHYSYKEGIKIPEGVQYERIIPLLIIEIQNHQRIILEQNLIIQSMKETFEANGYIIEPKKTWWDKIKNLFTFGS